MNAPAHIPSPGVDPAIAPLATTVGTIESCLSLLALEDHRRGALMCSMLATLYTHLIEANAEPAALEYVERARRYWLERVDHARCMDDLFDGEVSAHD